MYQAEVIESCKGRKDDLAVKSGEVLDIICTTDCPKGKWLARDCTKTYGYIPVENLKLDIQEMLVMGKKAKSTNKINNVGITDTEVTDGRSPNHFTYQESFEDDSEEWAEDDDTQFHPTIDTELPAFSAAARSVKVPGHQSQTNVHDNVQAKNEALQKLTTFFAQPKMPSPSNGRIPQMDTDFQILPPPDLYADIIMG
ncbi:FYN-binding protein 1 [Trichomycterus rosablanca]|uniref:FYN-binding protein 1 n=1 Tax=Trichomycterus rosablanca TaxID=2290929 RepID=UPI002F35723C